MRRDISVQLSVAIGILALAGGASGASSVEDQIKRLAERYNQIEAQLNRSVHYLTKTNSDGVTTTEQAWINGAGDPIKVAIERVDSAGRELTEYFGDDLTEPYERMFLLTRKETPSPDGGTQVDESRKYFGSVNGSNGELIRELRKSARFKAGDVLDTVHTPNTVVNLAEQPADNLSSEERAKADWELFSKPEKIVESLRKAGPPESDPFANVKGDSDKFRVIHGTASPDGRFAIALGFAREEIDWDAFYDKEVESYYAEGGEEDIRNYVIDLAQKKILGPTGAGWIGTRRRYNHPECVVTWSPDSSFFVQLLANKWASDDCVAGRITSGPKFVGAVNLLKTLSPKIYAFVKKPFNREEGGALSFYNEKLTNDGAIEMKAEEYTSSGERKGETNFSVSVRLRLRETPKGLSIEGVNMRRLPNER